MAASPLRYPGGKAALASFFAQLIDRLRPQPTVYVEPYAGGAGAGMVLLQQDLVDRVVINDVDPAVYCFWKSVVDHTDELVNLIRGARLDVEEWRRQKAIYREADETDVVGLGFAFFYLNRTNRSGILNAGPIGGVNQHGNYKIDARYSREQLVSRVAAIGAVRDQITVTCRDGMSSVHRYTDDPTAFVYVDPPYVDMGGSLYLNAFTHRDHADLAALLDERPAGNWLVTYDPSDFIRRLYRRHDVREYALTYSAHRATMGQELMILSTATSAALRAC